MFLSLRALLAAVSVALVTGCAGTNFKRPDSQAVVLGKSTSADVVRLMGEPRQRGEGLLNEKKVKTLNYAYANVGGQATEKDVVPARGMTFTTFEDVVVGEVFISSFQEDATDFDVGKLPAIVKGKTTRAEVTALLGQPHGQASYPVIKERGHRGLIYSYSHAKGTAFNMKFFQKSLVVAFTPNDVVSDVVYTSTGER